MGIEMASILKNFFPLAHKEGGVCGGSDDEDDPNNVEYSFALVYSGPPVTYDVPRAVPVDVSRIPVAAVLSPVSSLNDVPLPIVQPIVKSSLSKKQNGESQGESVVFKTEGAVCESSGRVDDQTGLVYANGDNFGPDNVGFKTEDAMCKSSGRVDDQNALVCAIGDDSAPVLTSGMDSSAPDGCDDGYDCRPELPDGICNNQVCEITEEGDDDGVDFGDSVNPANFDSIESYSTSPSQSSEIFSGQEDDEEEVPGHVRRPSVVTFRDPESNDVVRDELEQPEGGNQLPARVIAVRPGKKGTCYRCMKGNKFTDKEVCIVCGAKFCCHCVLRAMGTMPEGRKCVTCIGKQIDEAKRDNLGKCSGMLKHLLPIPEIKRIMKSERTCAVNQLPPQFISVNKKFLSKDELSTLQTCSYPPKKLRPGCYWYDKNTGYWGKEGKKPCQIIKPQLTVGGHLQCDASNGNTNILINGREITKPELRMLRMAGVKCEGTTSFWVNADGSYQEEGMKNIKGKIWETSKARLICAVLSLPVPPNYASSSGDEANSSVSNSHQKSLHKFLLVGCKKSGTSTIFKQAKIIYDVPFSEEERQSIKSMIQSNLYSYLAILLEGRERFEEESLLAMRRNITGRTNDSGIDQKTIYSIDQRLKNFSDGLLQVMASGNLESIFSVASRENARFVEDLWKSAAIQATYSRRSELELLPNVATHFLERAVEIANTDYEPSNTDILYAEGITPSKGLSYMEFSYPMPNQERCEPEIYQHDSSLRYQLIRAHPRIRGGNCKWLEMFEDVDIVLFCVSLTDYAEYSTENGFPVNKMMASKQLFESIVTHSTFEDKKLLLILNKFDLLEEKIKEVPLTSCEWFNDFNPVKGHDPVSIRSRLTNPPLAQRAFQYMAVKFKKLYKSLTDRKLYVSLATALEPESVDLALRYAREVLKWNEEELHYPHNQELSSASVDASSSSGLN